MSLNCPHAWEEYKKLDLAYDALRREYLALRGEQMDFANVPKEWLGKMREFRLKRLPFRAEMNSFFQEFDENYSTEVPEDTKLAILQNKIENNIKLGKRDLRFLYSIGGWPSDKTKKSLNDIIQIRNKRKDLSEIFDCREDQISFVRNDLEKRTDIVYCWDDLEFFNEEDESSETYAHNLKNHLKSLKGLRGSLELFDLSSAKDLIFPKEVGGDFSLYGVMVVDNVIFPERIGRGLFLHDMQYAEGTVLPKKIGDVLNLRTLLYAKGVVFPKEIGGSLLLNGLVSADGLVLPEKIDKDLHLENLTSVDGLDFSNCIIGGGIYFGRLPDSEKNKLRAKYPHIANKIIDENI